MFSDLRTAIGSYIQNFPTVLSFALLFVFVLPFTLLSNTFVSSGTVFLSYGFVKSSFFEVFLLLLMVLAFLFFYSIFVSLVVFAVRKELGKVRVNYYLNEKIHKFAFKYFYFLAIFSVLVSFVAGILIGFRVPIEIINFFILAASLVFIFLPQSIVVDEESLRSSVFSSIEFIAKNPLLFLFVVVFGFLAVLLLQLLEFAIDYFFLLGNYVSIVVALLFLVPFIEILKTIVYLKRFTIVTGYQDRD